MSRSGQAGILPCLVFLILLVSLELKSTLLRIDAEEDTQLLTLLLSHCDSFNQSKIAHNMTQLFIGMVPPVPDLKNRRGEEA